MPKPPNWHVWKFAELNHCDSRTAYRHKNTNSQEWQQFRTSNPIPNQNELLALVSRRNKYKRESEYGFFLKASKEYQKEIAEQGGLVTLGPPKKKSQYGFIISDTILECSWMLIGGTKRQNKKSPRVWWYEENGAWTDTPLHLCCWLLRRREKKKTMTLLSYAIRRQVDAARLREKWRTNPEHRRLLVYKRRVHRILNREKTRAYASNYRKMRRRDPGIRLKQNARSRFWKVMARVKAVQTTDDFNDFIECSSAFLRQHIERQFESWMNWDNYGPGWQMDHKIPLKHFDLFDPQQAKAAFHFSNLKPVSAAYNASKQARWADL